LMQQVRFRPDKEREFERDFLRFASDRYESRTTKTWTVAVTHVQDSGDWMDLYDIARYSHLDPGAWNTSDAYSLTWDVPTRKGWQHLDSMSRGQLVRRMQLSGFGAKAANWAAQFDLATLLHAPLLHCLGAYYRMPAYPVYVLCHEVMHVIEDWTEKTLVSDGVPPDQDREVIVALNAFVDKSCGWPAIQRLYLF